METQNKTRNKSKANIQSKTYIKSEKSHILKKTSGKSAESQTQKKNHTKKQDYQAAALMKELREYEKEGTLLYLNERKSRAGEIVHACMLAEDSDYMRDLISDEHEHITEIHFIRIPDCQYEKGK